jgi:predicted Holliday junction resolvase-like endonuclease
MNSTLVDFFALHREIFGVCPNEGCGAIFRLSDSNVYLKTKPEADWMDALDREDKRLERLEQKLSEREEEIRERARELGRKQAAKAARKIDPVFTPRKLNPDDAKVIFHPIDFVVFNGMKGGAAGIKNVILLDRAGVSEERRRLQNSIEKTVEQGRYEWLTLRVGDDGSIAEEK